VDSGDLAPTDFLLEGAAAHQGKLGGAPLWCQQLPGIEQESEILLPSEPPDIGHQQVSRPDPNSCPISGAPKTGMKFGRIHSPTPDTGVSDPVTV
jgi:hypothetical protein